MLGRANIGLAWATSPGGGEERQELVLVWVLASSQGEGPGDGPGGGSQRATKGAGVPWWGCQQSHLVGVRRGPHNGPEKIPGRGV